MKKRLHSLPILSAVLTSLAIGSQAAAQSPPLDAEQLALFEKGLSGKEGALEVSAQFATCFGFQSELYNHLTRKVEMSLEDIELYDTISSRSLRDGLTAVVLIFNYQPRPNKYVNEIADAARAEWRPRLAQMPGKIEKDVWAELAECYRIAPVTEYMLSLRDPEMER